MLCDNLEGWDGVGGGGKGQEGGDICIFTADSCCCMAETNTTFKAIILPIKNFIKGSETGDQPNLHFEESKGGGEKTIHTLLYFQCGLLYFKFYIE